MSDLFDSLLDEVARPTPVAPVMRSARLLFRPLTAADAPQFHRLINDWDICRKLPDAPFPFPAALADEWIATATADGTAGRARQFALVEAASGTLIGSAGLVLSRDRKSADLGYWLGRRHWGQGYGKEAAARLAAWGLAALNIARITATAAADNDASIAVLRRAGFTQTGKGSQNFQVRPGAKLPVLHFSLAREAPKPKPAGAPPAMLPVLLVVACALIDIEGRVLLARRPEGKKLAGLWELPGGKMDPGEVPEVALARELNEELGITVAPADLAPFTFASHAYENFHLLMPLYVCRRWQGEPTPRENQALAWVAPAALAEYPMPPADRPLIPMLRDFL